MMTNCTAEQLAALIRLAERVASLNRDAGEIGAGMLTYPVDEARAALAMGSQRH